MQNKLTKEYHIIPLTLPTVVRNCPKCNCKTNYQCSENFRVNANGKSLDVWLIYACEKCHSTFNMEIFSRVHPKTIDAKLYQAFLRNDKDYARTFAFDSGIHQKNKAECVFNQMEIKVEGELLSYETLPASTQLTLILNSRYSLDLRIDKILSQIFNLSREKIKELCKQDKIYCTETASLCKTKMKAGKTIIQVSV